MAFKPLLEKLGLYDRARFLKREWGAWREFRDWKRNSAGTGPVPHFQKRKRLSEARERFRLRTLIETGTYLGDMVESMRGEFDRVFSIELSPELAGRAASRFKSASNVEIVCGDSGKLLSALLKKVDGPALLWLDGHYSAGITARGDRDTPVMQELGAVFEDPREHVILIDDARCFGSGDYPSIEQVRKLTEQRRPGWSLDVVDDIIRILPPR